MENTCRCIIWHPLTDEEKIRQWANFDKARDEGAMATAMMYLASLSNPCLTREVS